jgi:hypothetical protein
MPGLKVLRLLSTAPDMKRLKSSVDLLRTALRNPHDWDTKIKYFTMGELMKAVDDWMNESHEMAARRSEEDAYYLDTDLNEDDLAQIQEHLEAEQARLETSDEDEDEDEDLDEDEDEELMDLQDLDPNALFELFMSELEKDEEDEDGKE